ncbi:MAG: hypothetical protein ACFFG0_02615 [Candidatus Thorarchaeota archaeon]
MSENKELLQGPMGGLPGSGRTPKALQLKKYKKVLQLLDDSVEEAFQVLRDGLRNKDPYMRLRCAEIILKKYLPDKKVKELTGPGGGPIELSNNVDKRTQIINIVNILDEIESDDLKKKVENGNFRLLEDDSRGEESKEERVEEEKKT